MAVHLEKLYLNGRHQPTLLWLGALSVATTFVVFILGDRLFDQEVHRFLAQIVLALWALAPPSWFFYEYFWHFPKHGNPNAGFEKLKAAQSVSTKVWAAAAILLAALYAAKFH
jgi:hypothetical protein